MTSSSNNVPLLEVRNLKVGFDISGSIFGARRRKLYAVDDVSFKIGAGEIVGLVGESGSGKTTTGRAIIRLAPVESGRILYNGTDITGLSARGFMPYRKKMQMIFQDPFNSLNPRMSVQGIISEPLDIHFGGMTQAQKKARVLQLLELVGLPASAAARYPHEFSGGQRQRIGIARALAVEPEFLICDEPVSALDVSVQAQIVNLLLKLRDELGIAMLFVAHDIAVVEYVSSRMMVMTQGKIVEQGASREVCAHPQHPYTKKLIDAVPKF